MIRIVPPYIVFRGDLMKPKYWTDMCSFAFLHQRGVGVRLRTTRSLLNMSFNPIFKCIPSRLIGVACGSRCGADYFCSCFIACSENSNIDFGSLICLVTGDIRLKSCLQSWLISKICYNIGPLLSIKSLYMTSPLVIKYPVFAYIKLSPSCKLQSDNGVL